MSQICLVDHLGLGSLIEGTGVKVEWLEGRGGHVGKG